MSESQFQVLRGVGFVVALTLALLLQRLRPHARLRGSWSVNGGLWFTNLIVLGTVCGACACTVVLDDKHSHARRLVYRATTNPSTVSPDGRPGSPAAAPRATPMVATPVRAQW